jgi:hypothetical protein
MPHRRQRSTLSKRPDRPQGPGRRRWLALAAGALLLGGVAALLVVMALTGLSPGQAAALLQERSPLSMLRHAERRLEGHPNLQALAGPVLGLLRSGLEREPPPVLADLGKGQRPGGLAGVAFGPDGRPQATRAREGPAATAAVPDQLVSSVEGLALALREARAGQVIEVLAGSYRITGTLNTGGAGTALQPITLRARQPGSVVFLVDTVQALLVSQPYWIFENLDWRGACAQDDHCEHAMHVVGAARGTVIVNNRMTDFNAHIKINGERGAWPDDGLVQFNTLHNTRARRTQAPVVPIDLVAASGWQLLDNRIENFVKHAERHPSYGLFMKGAGQGGRIERNLVICTSSGLAQPGLRVGLSVGNGGSTPESCRDRRCDAEHFGAVVANNVVAHCNDAGIDVAKSVATVVVHNTLINTQGILVRNPPSDARVVNNLLEGGIRARQGTQAEQAGNVDASRLGDLLQDPDGLDLRWRELPNTGAVHEQAPLDFCARPRPAANPPGATTSARC